MSPCVNDLIRLKPIPGSLIEKWLVIVFKVLIVKNSQREQPESVSLKEE